MRNGLLGRTEWDQPQRTERHLHLPSAAPHRASRRTHWWPVRASQPRPSPLESPQGPDRTSAKGTAPTCRRRTGSRRRGHRGVSVAGRSAGLGGHTRTPSPPGRRPPRRRPSHPHTRAAAAMSPQGSRACRRDPGGRACIARLSRRRLGGVGMAPCGETRSPRPGAAYRAGTRLAQRAACEVASAPRHSAWPQDDRTPSRSDRCGGAVVTVNFRSCAYRP
jgi:hypothetical protein